MKNKLLRTSIFMLLILVYHMVRPEAQESQSDLEPSSRSDPPFLMVGQAWADSIMAGLSLEDRIAQMIMVYGYSNMGPAHEKAVLKQVKKQKVGGILFFQGEPLEQARLTNLYQEAADIPLLVAIDGENGLGMRLKETMTYPATMILGSITDNSLIYRLGADMARQFRRLGVHMNLAPVADINNNPSNPVIGTRSFGEERGNVAAKVVALMEGMQDHGVLVASGKGMLDFEPDIARIKPDIFVVNEDGHTPGKKDLCEKYGVEYKILQRIPEEGLPARASSSIKKEKRFPFRICISGGWMDQPWVSSIQPGSVIVAQLWPTIEFNDRSGMATSSRTVAIDLWGDKYPDGDPIQNARLLFGAENPPGSKYISGSQDHIGLLNPGISRLYYNGDFWPEQIDSTIDKDTCDWLSSVLHLVPLSPRPMGYDPIREKHLEKASVQELGEAGELCWQSILDKDVDGLGKSMKQTFMAWKKILPLTVPDYLMDLIVNDYFPNYAGAISSGSGGGYIVVASEQDVPGEIKVKVRY